MNVWWLPISLQAIVVLQLMLLTLNKFFLVLICQPNTCTVSGINPFQSNESISVQCYFSCRNHSFDLNCKSNGWFLYKMQSPGKYRLKQLRSWKLKYENKILFKHYSSVLNCNRGFYCIFSNFAPPKSFYNDPPPHNVTKMWILI